MPKVSTRKRPSQSRFVRAVHVESDIDQTDALDGYVLTATGRSILRRIAPAYSNQPAPRAWTLTGPYGTGKSAFAVFAANLFTHARGAGPKKARQILQQSDPDLAGELLAKGRQSRRGLMPVAITGTREPIDRAILRGLDHSLTDMANGHGRSVVREVRRCLKHATGANVVGARNLTELLAATMDKVCTPASRLDGIFLILDELGKLLEFANSQPSQSDVAVLQSIAEFSERCSKPCLLLTILHQDFGAYANRLSCEDRAEWDKVRGRFEDIAFEEPAEEMLRLAGRALAAANKNDRRRKSVTPQRSYRALCDTAWKLGLAPGSMTKGEFLGLLMDCWPLHPLVTVTLGNVFRRLAQNERSVFSFLYSSEPFGLSEFLDMAPASRGALYGIDRLYDYLSVTARDGLFATPQAKRWAEIETILERQTERTREEVFFVKAIGLMNVIGQSGRIQASRDLLAFAAQQVLGRVNAGKELKQLASRKVVVPRRYNGTFALWEGSDVDLEAQVRIARDRLDPTQTTAQLAAKYFHPRPIVARRHSYRTGALRYLPIHFLTPGDLDRQRLAVEGPAILIVLPDSAREEKRAVALARHQRLRRRGDVLIAIPAGRQELSRTVRELACLEWVRKNVSELDGDRTARRELAIQTEGVGRKLTNIFNSILQPEDGDSRCVWYHKGKKVRFRSRRHFQDYLSAVCDELFSESPCLQNELINRRELSSAAAAARRNLIDAMITHSTEEHLAISGTPPEKSMYLSLLHKPGIHRKGPSGWRFRPPRRSADEGLQAVWKSMVRFFAQTEKGARPLSELFALLSKPPYGVLDGPLPVLLCAALLVHDHEVALYKEGSFVPVLNVPDFELLMKAPERYTVQRCRISGVRASVFEQVAKLVGRDIPGPKIGKPQILQVVRPFLKFVRGLNDFVMRTEQLSETAINIRDTLSKAREPDSLLFTDLPRACGVAPFRTKQRATPNHVNQFIKRLRAGLAELQQRYQRLLNELTGAIRVSFGVEGTLATVRKTLTSRAGLLRNCSGDPALKTFVERVLQTALDDDQWLEAVVAVLALRLPAVWRDDDRARFDHNLATTARLFSHVEGLAFGRSKLADSDEAVRIGITTPDGVEVEKVVRISRSRSKAVDQLEKQLEAILPRAKGSGNNDAVLAAIARVAKRRLR